MGRQDRDGEKICNLFPIRYNPVPLSARLSSLIPAILLTWMPLSAAARQWSTSAYVAPVFEIYRYEATQFRFGAAAELEVAPAWRVGFPLGVTFGDGFSSFQAGGQVTFDSKRWDRWVLYHRGGILFEHFWGNDRSFEAGTIDLATGVGFQLRPKLWLGIEPLSLEIMPLASDNVPWNIRGQVRFEVRGDW